MQALERRYINGMPNAPIEQDLLNMSNGMVRRNAIEILKKASILIRIVRTSGGDADIAQRLTRVGNERNEHSVLFRCASRS